MNRHNHFSWCRRSRDRFSIVKDWDVFPRVVLRYNSGYSGSSNLPKLKLYNFDRNPLEWPVWSSMFRAAISGMGYTGPIYGAAWRILEKKFGRLYWIIDAQLESLLQRKLGECSRLNRCDEFRNFCFELCECAQRIEADWQSSSTLYMAVNKLPHVLKEKWWFYVDDKDDDWLDLVMTKTWISRMAFKHEGFSNFKGERWQEDRRSTNREKQLSKTSNFNASSIVKETKQLHSDHCPLADGTHRISNCPLFRNMSLSDWYAAVRKQRLCYGCLGKRREIQNWKLKVWCQWMHQNQMLHSEN